MLDQDSGAQVAEVEGLLERLESLTDSPARDTALATVQAVLELYGDGLGRIVDAVGPARTAGLVEDDLVSHLLLLHGLHPVSVEERVLGALRSVRPYMESHGGDVELVDVFEGVAHVRLRGSCEGCPASAMTLKLAIEDAVLKAAPDVDAVQAVGFETPDPLPDVTALAADPGGASVLRVDRSPAADRGGGAGGAPDAAPAGTQWTPAGALPQLSGGGTLLSRIAGEPVLFLKIADTPYAYRPRCPACEGSLADAALAVDEVTVAALACPGCGHRYDVRRAGRCLDAPQLHLEPVPLLVDDVGLVRVAVQAAGVR